MGSVRLRRCLDWSDAIAGAPLAVAPGAFITALQPPVALTGGGGGGGGGGGRGVLPESPSAAAAAPHKSLLPDITTWVPGFEACAPELRSAAGSPSLPITPTPPSMHQGCDVHVHAALATVAAGGASVHLLSW